MPDEAISKLLYKFVTPESVIRIQGPYVDLFAEVGARKVLDLGSGRGLFLELLREAGVEAHGVDSDAVAVARCKENGFQVHESDVLEFLEQASDDLDYDGVFCSHLIEHLDAGMAMAMLRNCAKVMAPGGRLVLVTPNVENLEVWSETFWLDPTHVRPYPRPLIAAMMEQVSLTVSDSFVDPATRKYSWTSPGDMVPAFLRYGLTAFRGMDSLVIGDKPA